VNGIPTKGVMCHRSGFTVSCFTGVTEHGCQLWTALKGQEPQSAAVVDKHGCADAWGPVLQVETTQQVRQLGAAIESLRNEGVKAQAASQAAAERALRLITGSAQEPAKFIEQG
jgi:hypothetical protein